MHRVRRTAQWQADRIAGRVTWARQRPLPERTFRIKQHKSLLLRQLGESEMWLQHNKVTNLRIAADLVDGVVIRPGETFSFNKVVGLGYVHRDFVQPGTSITITWNGARIPAVVQ